MVFIAHGAIFQDFQKLDSLFIFFNEFELAVSQWGSGHTGHEPAKSSFFQVSILLPAAKPERPGA